MELDLDVLPRGPMELDLDVLPRGPKIESWMCFPEVQGLNFERASQRFVDLNLDVLPRGLMD